ncbi:MAG: hypothetical protein ABIS20_18470 [Thermoanaerobaculia bacterium]
MPCSLFVESAGTYLPTYLPGWSRRYQAIIVSGEEEAQTTRLKYVLANGCKEDLVARPQDWPGVHASRALVAGEALTGTWFDRTQEYAARRRGEDFDRLKYATTALLTSPLKRCTFLKIPRRTAGVQAAAPFPRKPYEP